MTRERIKTQYFKGDDRWIDVAQAALEPHMGEMAAAFIRKGYSEDAMTTLLAAAVLGASKAMEDMMTGKYDLQLLTRDVEIEP
jgi:hypothetical protein